jgi:hypothetical protein
MSEEKEYGLFDYVNSINNKEYIFDEATYNKKNYSQYVINTAFSYFPDTVLYANEINKYPKATDKQHYDFLYHSTTKHKRYSKWNKKITDERVKQVADYYDIGLKEAKEILSILPAELIDRIENMKGSIIK